MSTAPNGAEMELATSTLNRIAEIELLAESVLTMKHELVELDRRRQQAREALRAFPAESTGRAWFVIGDMFFKLPKSTIEGILKADHETLTRDINQTNENLKPKVKLLHELEGEREGRRRGRFEAG